MILATMLIARSAVKTKSVWIVGRLYAWIALRNMAMGVGGARRDA